MHRVMSLSLIRRFGVLVLLSASWPLLANNVLVQQQVTQFPEPHGPSFTRQHFLLTGFHHRHHVDRWHDRYWWRTHRRDYWHRRHWAHRHWNDPYWRHHWPWWYRHHYWNDFVGAAVTVPLAYEAGKWLFHESSPQSQSEPVIVQQQSITTGMNYSTGISSLPANARTVLKGGKTYYQWQDKTYKYDWDQHAYVVVPNFKADDVAK
ncbi:hypothetical protein JQC92_19410 [Shewanella sp. 202IG2-18]|uniref:hypothetical protein n=1 Tax=Parashewanella hymeniacidonis TaxID=2807618 RepID=UPI0019605D18|nr:hypothetical protein [Parashewanella hymeniacidonis]MBM7074170.1 hypothetical protein [Parashewanella hymeniacidonis]